MQFVECPDCEQRVRLPDVLDDDESYECGNCGAGGSGDWWKTVIADAAADAASVDPTTCDHPHWVGDGFEAHCAGCGIRAQY